MKDLLHGCLAVGKEVVDALALERACSQGNRRALSHAHHGGRFISRHIHHGGRVPHGNDEQMATVYGLDIHERDDQIVAVDKTHRSFTGKNPAEDAIGHGVMRKCRLTDSVPPQADAIAAAARPGYPCHQQDHFGRVDKRSDWE